MELFWSGTLGFVSTFMLILLITEANIFFDEAIKHKFELRKGKFKKHSVQSFFIFTHKESIYKKLLLGAAFLPVFIAAAMLPNIRGQIAISPPHSFWVFILVMTLSPVVEFFLQLFSSKEGDDFLEIRLQEKSMAGFALLLMSMISFTLLIAADDIAAVINIQKEKGWLVLQKPASLFIFFSLIVVVYYICQQKIFSKSHNKITEKESEERKFSLEVWKAVWLVFIVTVFFGGGSAPEVIVKTFVLNVGAVLVFEGMTRIREDQSEAMIVWEMTPLVLFFVLLTLIFVGLG